MNYFSQIQHEFLKNAIDFPSQSAFEKYRKDHPKADLRKHKVVKHKDYIGKEEQVGSYQVRVMTPDRGWVYFDHDDEGRKDLDYEREKIESFLKSERE
ncbi:MAG: hypothetical protein Q7R33_05280 [Nitrosarchaeum sp.]|nr:hypothetical protein [Nitrosarchaeum sp.]